MNEEEFIPTGSTMLDLYLGGGYGLRKVVHVYGEPSTNKTGVAVEAVINFMRTYQDGQARYCDAEAAFNKSYVVDLGLDTSDTRLTFFEPDATKDGFITLESFAADLNKFINELPADKPGLYILDSLDSVPLEAEIENPAEMSGYGMEKAKFLSRMFRAIVQKLKSKRVCLFVISQVRDNTNRVNNIGPLKKPASGNAIRFYASQSIQLTHLQHLTKIVDKQEMPTGIKFKAKVMKNKCGTPDKYGEFTLIFGYGIDDVTDNLNWLSSRDKIQSLPDEIWMGSNKKPLSQVSSMVERVHNHEDRKKKRDLISTISDTVCEVYHEIENKHKQRLPRGKYE